MLSRHSLLRLPIRRFFRTTTKLRWDKEPLLRYKPNRILSDSDTPPEPRKQHRVNRDWDDRGWLERRQRLDTAPFGYINNMTEGNSSKRSYGGRRDRPNKKAKMEKQKSDYNITADDVLAKDIEVVRERDLLVQEEVPEPEGGATEPKKLPEKFSNTTVTITHIGANGDGLGVTAEKDRVYVVPFTVPGDEVEAKIIYHKPDHTYCDFVRVIKPGPQRDDSRIGCKYFAECGGCQYQMMSYEDQLEKKRNVMQRAFANFSDIDPAILPEVGQIMPSPLKYSYRTKLTPHFDGPRKGGWKEGMKPVVGFMVKGVRKNIEIEDCPIGTPVLRKNLPVVRQYVYDNLNKVYKKGATLLLRESTVRLADEAGDVEVSEADGSISKYFEEKLCITDHKAITTEYVGRYKFQFLAGDFFQNNNSILLNFVNFVKSNLHLPVPGCGDSAPKYLVDAYCGSGLFSITCGEHFEGVIGVDVSPNGVKFAQSNAELNGIKNAKFIVGNAEAIFEGIKFPPSETSVIIDPPRKGCDKLFLDQLLDFAPKRIVYISCNVHTQARDIGYFLNHQKGKGYNVDLITGFDFFPQTYHVEGCAVLTRHENHEM